ncbi:fasciclin domain-containing protein [uncultured Bacteroides sp.]|uniref:fasciclin domain-containing protein n=1 Tax=uncultured Bacteroides sp. TaxID=162156 RepID=UPI002AABA1AA|nr:fasciclin domain-containing protein [uncultured Bacteroides sp.]
MKKIFIILLFICPLFISCNDTWDDYFYSDKGLVVDESSKTLTEFFQENPEYSQFYGQLKSTELDKELTKDQKLTLWVANNEAMTVSGIKSNDILRMKYHMNYLPFIHSDLKNGLRIRSLNGIYLQISQTGEDLYVNNAKIVKTYVLKNGVIHVIDRLLKSKVNMYDYLRELGDDYSIIRDSIFAQNVRVFDKANSIPTGVDKTGNTLYDSVFYVYNPLFEKAKFNSEFSQFTVLLPSNDVVKKCFEKLNTQYRLMGKEVTKADTILAMKWLKEAAFYNGVITDFSNKDTKSAFDRVWRDPIQKIDEINSVELSNGRLYYVTDLKIPNNVILGRVKSLVEYWQYLSEDQKDWYQFKGVIKKTDGSDNISILTDAATPKPTVLPNYLVLSMTGDPASTQEFSVSFPPLDKYVEGTKTLVRKMQVPPGEYNLYMGFRSSLHPYVNVYFANDDPSGNYIYNKVGENIQASLSSPWNFDRVNETEAELKKGGTAKWDGLGGLVGVVNVSGDSMTSFRIKVVFSKLASAGNPKKMGLYHWALKPTANNY